MNAKNRKNRQRRQEVKKKFHILMTETITKAASIGMTIGFIDEVFCLVKYPAGTIIMSGKLSEIRTLVERYCKLKAFL